MQLSLACAAVLLGACVAEIQNTTEITAGCPSDHGPYDAMYLLVGAILAGTAVLHLSMIRALRHVPVTVAVFVLGIIFAKFVENEGFGLGGSWLDQSVVMRTYTSWININPHLLLVVFLPPLLFGDAIGIDTHVARRTGGQFLILAGPGVVIGSLATGALLYFILPSGLSFALCVLVGSVLASTDPIAVVGLLRDLGASPILTMQIQGESLFNDAGSIVLFEVAYMVVGGSDLEARVVLTHVLKSSILAGLFGACVGYSFYCWIRGASDHLSHRSSSVQIALSIACAYGSYLVAEGIFGLSGVVVTVVAGLVLADKMWPVLVARQAMTEIWHLVEVMGNFLVFFLAGMLTGKTLVRHAPKDCFVAFATYVGVTVIRFAMILLLRPLLNCVGEPVSLKDVLVMTWGGLRGMVGLALAILVARDRAGGTLSEEDGERVLFIVAFVVTMTLIVNAVTFPALCRRLGISPEVMGRQALIRNVARRADMHVKALIDEHAGEECSRPAVAKALAELHANVEKHLQVTDDQSELPFYHAHAKESIPRDASGHSWVKAMTLGACDSMPVPNVEALWEQFEARKLELLTTGAPITKFKFGSQLPEIRRLLNTCAINPHQVKVVREVFLEILRTSYWAQVREGCFVVGGREPRVLLDSVSIAGDKTATGLVDWYILQRDLRIQAVTSGQCGSWEDGCPVIHAVSTETQHSSRLSDRDRRAQYKQQLHWVQTIDAFIRAHHEAQRRIASFFGEGEHIDTPEEAFVILESQCQVFAAATARACVRRPVLRRMQTTSQILRLARRYHEFVLDAHESGVLLGREAEALLEPAGEIMRELERGRRRLTAFQVGSPDEESAAALIQNAYRRLLMLRSVRRLASGTVSLAGEACEA